MDGAGTAALPELSTIVQLLACFLCNNHTICDEEQRPIGLHTCRHSCCLPCTALSRSARRHPFHVPIPSTGIGLFLRGAMLNHSCTPNAVQSFSGRRIVFRAVSPIPKVTPALSSHAAMSLSFSARLWLATASPFGATEAVRNVQPETGLHLSPGPQLVPGACKGAEATIAYVELAATREERRAELLASYHFDIDAGQVLCTLLCGAQGCCEPIVSASPWHVLVQAAPEQAPLASAIRADGGLVEVFAQPSHRTMTPADAEMTAVHCSAGGAPTATHGRPSG